MLFFLSSIKDSFENSWPLKAAHIYWLSYHKSTLCLVECIKFFDKNRQIADLYIFYQLSASLCKNVKQQSTTWLVPSKIQPTQTRC